MWFHRVLDLRLLILELLFYLVLFGFYKLWSRRFLVEENLCQYLYKYVEVYCLWSQVILGYWGHSLCQRLKCRILLRGRLWIIFSLILQGLLVFIRFRGLGNKALCFGSGQKKYFHDWNFFCSDFIVLVVRLCVLWKAILNFLLLHLP